MERQYVPTALQSELTEYVSLLRALRSSNTLDLSLHLTRHGRVDSSTSNSESDDSDDPNDRTSVAFASAEGDAGTKRKRGHSSRLFRKRDTWTRWPLLLTDLHKPAWTFDDEVALAASQAQKIFPPPFSSPTESSSPRSPNEYSGETSDFNCDDELDDPDYPSYYKFIGISASTFLSNILALLSLHIPPRPPSMQNRIEPLDWRSVLEIVSVYGDTSVVDEQYVSPRLIFFPFLAPSWSFIVIMSCTSAIG